MKYFYRMLWVGLLCTAIPSATYCQILELELDGTLEGTIGGQRIFAELGPGARFIASAEGQGVEPGTKGHAVKIAVPDELWQSKGTLAFRFRPSRTIRFASDPKQPLKTTFVECPLFKIDLLEHRNHPRVQLSMLAAGDYQPKGSVYWSHLKGGQWYHFAITWDADGGRLDAYLNGACQQEVRLRGDARKPWELGAACSGPLLLGGTLGEGDDAATIAIDSVQLYSEFMGESDIASTLEGRKVAPLTGEGRTVYSGPLDLSGYKLTPVYEADFAKPLNVVHEDELFEGETRVRLPKGKDWVLEGPGRAWTENGQLHLESLEPESGGHVVLWNTRVFPGNFLLEFGMSPEDSKNGLNIVFFCARPIEGGGVFDLKLPRRGGQFKNYHSGALNNYHISYWACSSGNGGIPRRTANLRKNFGFFLPACGVDRIAEQGPGPHVVRLLKFGGKIQLETRGELSLAFDDDGSTYGPIWGDGYIGLRQMAHTHRASYTCFKVWRVEAKP